MARLTDEEFKAGFVARVPGDDATPWACAYAYGEAIRTRESESEKIKLLDDIRSWVWGLMQNKVAGAKEIHQLICNELRS